MDSIAATIQDLPESMSINRASVSPENKNSRSVLRAMTGCHRIIVRQIDDSRKGGNTQVAVGAVM